MEKKYQLWIVISILITALVGTAISTDWQQASFPSVPPVFAEMNYDGNFTELMVGLNTVNVYGNFTSMNHTFGVGRGFIFNNSRELIVTVNGTYIVSYVASIGTVSAGLAVFDLSVGLDGGEVSTTFSEQTIANTNEHMVVAGSGMVNATEGQRITLMVRDRTTPLRDASYTTASLSIFLIDQ